MFYLTLLATANPGLKLINLFFPYPQLLLEPHNLLIDDRGSSLSNSPTDPMLRQRSVLVESY